MNPITFRLLGSLVLTAAMLSCASTPSKQAAALIETTESKVMECEYLGLVDGRSGWGMAASGIGRHNAKVEAMEKAVKLGATHLVWERVGNVWAPYASAHAYRCEGK